MLLLLLLLFSFSLSKSKSNNEILSSKTTRRIDRLTSDYLTISAPSTDTPLTSYFLVPFTITSSSGVNPIVTVSFDCNPEYNATGDSNSAIIVRVPPFSGACNVIATASGYATATATYTITSLTLCEAATITGTPTKDFNYLTAQSTYSLYYPHAGPIGSLNISSFVGTLNGPVYANQTTSGLTLFSTQDSIYFFREPSCPTVTSIAMSLSDSGTLDLNTNCSSYATPEAVFKPRTPLSTFYGLEAQGNYVVRTQATAAGSGTITDVGIDVCLQTNYISLSMDSDTVQISSYPVQYFLAYGVETDYYGVPEVNIVLDCNQGDTSTDQQALQSAPQTLGIAFPTVVPGLCTLSATPVDDPTFLGSDSIVFAATSMITITSPSDGYYFLYGSSIPITIEYEYEPASDITVVLNCSGVTTTATAGGSTSFSIDNISGQGNCSLSIVPIPFYETNVVYVNVYSQLTIDSPANGSTIVGGSYYNLTVNSTDGNTSVPITVYFDCQYGSFEVEGFANVPQYLPMNSSIAGSCLVTANSTSPYYNSSTPETIIDVLTNITINTPTAASPWAYYQLNNASITAAFGQSINGTVNLACTNNSSETLNANLTLVNSTITDYNLTSYGECNLTTLLDPSTFVNAVSVFSVTVPVTLDAPTTFYRQIPFSIIASTPLNPTLNNPLQLAINCTDIPSYTVQIIANTETNLTLDSNGTCTLQTLGDEAFLASNSVVSRALLLILQTKQVNIIPGGNFEASITTNSLNSTFANLTLTCGPNSTVYPSVLVNAELNYTTYAAPANYNGDCILQAIDVNLPSWTSNSIAVTLAPTPALYIYAPLSGDAFNSGSIIPVFVSSNDNQSPTVTVQLNCSDSVITSATGSVGTQINLASTSALSGVCYIQQVPIDGFLTSPPVFVQFNRQLLISSPSNGADLVVGANFTLLVSVAGSSSDSANVTFNCSNSFSFVERVQINVPSSIRLPTSAANTTCTVIATTSDSYYTSSSPITITGVVQTILVASLNGWKGGSYVPVFITTIDNASFDVILETSCATVSYSQIIPTEADTNYTLPASLNGIGCVVTMSQLPPNYLSSTPLMVNVGMNQQLQDETTQRLAASNFLRLGPSAANNVASTIIGRNTEKRKLLRLQNHRKYRRY